MMLKTIKTASYTFLCAFVCSILGGGVVSIKAVVTAEDIKNHLVKKTMTSQVMEEYVRERLKFRISYWQEQFKEWQKRWNIVTDTKFYQTFKLTSLSDQAFNELCKIPFYIFVVGNNEQWLAELRQAVLSRVYVYSDPEAQKLYHQWYKRELDKNVPGSTSFGGACTIFINDYATTDRFQKDSSSYYLWQAFNTIEHELTHVEQRCEAWVLSLCARHTNKILDFIQKNQSWRRFTTRFAYEFLYMTEQVFDKNIEILDHSFLSSHVYSQAVKCESEADKVGLKFFEYPMEAYHAWIKFFYLNERSNLVGGNRYNEKGYCTKENEVRLIIKRLIKEGDMKVDDRFKAQFVEKEKTNFPRRKIINLPTYFDFHNAGHLDEHGQLIMRSRL